MNDDYVVSDHFEIGTSNETILLIRLIVPPLLKRLCS